MILPPKKQLDMTTERMACCGALTKTNPKGHHMRDDFTDIKTRTQRQDALTDQIRDLRVVAGILGMYDAQDWMFRQWEGIL